MELPDYSKQLMQQLQALRKEGNFCDCTILVGDVSHRAHKLVLAASSMLFRSLLDGSDTISIDTVVVSSQEFERLLDIVYTGRLPQGKHNISQIITTADNLQMFDVAIGCKNILASLLGQPTSPQLAPTMPPQTQTQTQTQLQLQVKTEEMGGTRPGKATVMSGPQGVNCTEEAEFGTESVNAAEARAEERRNGEGPSPKTIPVSVLGSPESFLPDKDQSAHRSKIEENNASVSHGSDSALPECSSGLKELLVEVPSMPELLTQAALDTLGEKEGEVVRQCCEGARAGTAANRLGARLREGALSGKGMLALLSAVREKSSSSCSPQLLSLLKQLERRTQQKEANASPQQPLSPSLAANSTNEDKEPEDKGCADGVVDMKVKPDSSPASPASPSQPYSCRWCKKGFSFKCRLRAHAKRCPKSQELKHQCPLCPKRLPTPRALQRHRAEVHPETARIKKKVACDLCGRTFAHPSGMIYHKRTEHFDEKPYSCEQCGAKFGANSSLKNHIRLHTGEKPYHCKHCDMTFSVAAALAYHTKKKHSEGKMYSCQYCEALFAQSIELTRHVRTHTGDRPYVCRECGKGYSQASGLTVHLQTFHNILEPHDCQKCRLSFRSLEEHQQHIQECHPKDFHRCAICHKVFTSAALLDKHKGTHTGLKPYSCDLCHKSYQQLSGLWYHNRTTHPEVYASQTRISLKTLVQCDICFKFFPNTCSLSSHQVAEHSESAALAVRCPHCPAIFAGQEEMLEHAGSQHFASDCPAFGCSLCPLVCPTQLQLQEHFLSCHTGALAEQGGGDDNKEGGEGAQASTSNEVTPAVGISLDQSQLAGPQQVFVSLGDGEGGGSSSEVVAVNVDDLLNGTITFICGDKQ